MRYPAYPKYKDSGLKWLGSIPDSWQILRAKTIFSLAKRPASEEHEIVTAFRDGQVTLRINRRIDGFTNAIKEIGYQGVCKGDLVIHAMDAFAGAVGVSDSDGKCSPVYSCCVPAKAISSEFYARLVRTMALTGFIESLAKGVRERSTDFRWGDFSTQYLPVPSYEEQGLISSFIGNETAKIDALIAEQEKLVTLLQEKRQTVISHAVTKGLNPDAPMKDSGVEWLGEVPEEWALSRVKHLCFLCYGIGEPPEYQPEGVPLIRATNIKSGKIVSNNLAFVDPKDIPTQRIVWLGTGDIVVVRSGAYTGDTAIITDEYSGSIAGFDMVLKTYEANDSKYILYCLLSTGVKKYQIDSKSIRAAQPHLNALELGDCLLVLPPLSEQQSIAEYLDAETTKIDALITESQKAVELLKERRNALISAAVTGKIDVRNIPLQEAV